MSQSETDRIEKQIEIAAPVNRVWKALTDYQQFGDWFRVNLESPFVVGEKTAGNVTHAGYEHVRLEVIVVSIEPMTRFAFEWHPHPVDPEYDYSSEPLTTVEFTLAPTESGTQLTLVESGFGAVPESRRHEAFRMNEQGWAGQMKNIEAFIKRDN